MNRWITSFVFVGLASCSLLFNGDDLRHSLDLGINPDDGVLDDGGPPGDDAGDMPPDLLGADLTHVKLNSFMLSRQPPFYGGGAGVNVVGVALTDLDGDLQPDLVVGGGNTNLLYLRKGTSTPPFFAAAGSGPMICQGVGGASTSLTDLMVADFDGDAAPDVAVLCSDAANPGELELFYGTGGISFAAPTGAQTVSLPTLVHTQGITIGDFNGDAYADFAVGNYDDASLSVFPGVGMRQWNIAQTHPTGGNPFALAAGSIAGNVTHDLVVAQKSSGGVNYPVGATTYYNTLASEFAQLNAVGIPFASPQGLRLEQLDGMHSLDLAMLGPNKVSIFHADATNHLPVAPDVTVSVGLGNTDFQFADLDNDGLVDLLVTASGPPMLWVALATGLGTFAMPQSFDLGQDPNGAATSGAPRLRVGDVNHDGPPDVVVALPDGTVVVFLNTST